MATKHNKKWTEAANKVQNPDALINGYTAAQWDHFAAVFKKHLYTGADAAKNDEPIGPGDLSPNQIVAEVTARSDKATKYLPIASNMEMYDMLGGLLGGGDDTGEGDPLGV